MNSMSDILLRAPLPGDIGWVIHRQAVLYWQEHGWDWRYEALAASVLGEFATNFDPEREDAWIAERNGQIVGSIFLTRSGATDLAKLRLLYVEPDARGLGLGKLLVDTCMTRGRELGYRRMTLWTNDALTAARHIYEAVGFKLVKEYHHNSFGQDLVGQVWEVEL